MLGYIEGEKYEDFFYRKHGFKHTEQSRQAREQNVDIKERVISIETKLSKM